MSDMKNCFSHVFPTNSLLSTFFSICFLTIFLFSFSSNIVARPVSVSLYPIQAFWDFNYSIDSINIDGEMADKTGIGLNFKVPIYKGSALQFGYEYYGETHSGLRSGTFDISAIKLGGAYDFKINDSLILFTNIGANYSFWTLNDVVIPDELIGQIGYQASLGIRRDHFSIELGYHVLKSFEDDYMPITEEIDGLFVVSSYADFLVEVPGLFLITAYHF